MKAIRRYDCRYLRVNVLTSLAITLLTHGSYITSVGAYGLSPSFILRNDRLETIAPNKLAANNNMEISYTTASNKHHLCLHALYSMSTDDAPSDYDSTDLTPDMKTAVVDTNDADVYIRDDLKRELLLLASVTNRGEFASLEERNIIIDLVTQLEALNPTANPASSCDGEWDLCLTSTQSFRSSPFFMSIRSAIGDENKAIALNGFDIHEKATAAGKVGRVRQTVRSNAFGAGSGTNTLELKSEVVLDVGILPGLPVSLKGTVVSNAEVTITSAENWEVRVTDTSVKGSNVPFLDQFLDDNPIQVPIGDAYEAVLGNVPVSIMKTFYVDEGMRITRDEDDNFFVYVRE